MKQADGGSGLPLPPAPGQAPAAVPNGAAATIPVGGSGPGLLSGTASLHGTRLSVPVACSAAGRVTLSVPTLGVLAQARFRCIQGRGIVPLTVTPAAARSISGMGAAIADLAFVQGGTKEQLSLALGPRVQGAGTWVSYQGLACGTPSSDQANLLAPNFTDTPTTTVDVRPWLAYYTASTGWQWIGTGGANASSWYRWTATPEGVAEWQTQPLGTVSPWSWGPISVTPGRGTYLIAVFEAVYWYSHPVYVWHYAPSGTGGGASTTYCAYP